MKPTPLIAPDPERCQALKPNGWMRMGGDAHSRCLTKPTVIAKENRPGKDGRRGSMSLCDSCAAVMVVQLGPDFASLKEIRRQRNRSKANG